MCHSTTSTEIIDDFIENVTEIVYVPKLISLGKDLDLSVVSYHFLPSKGYKPLLDAPLNLVRGGCVCQQS